MSITIYPNQIKEIAPECTNTILVAAALNPAMNEYDISSNVDRVCAFLAHVAVESAGFMRLRENLNYSQALRLQTVWPTHFPTFDSAVPYINNPEALANKVYANRLGNGGEQSGDGYRYRGGGFIQITGKDSYQRIGISIGSPLVTAPNLIEELPIAALSAAFFWQTRGLNALADEVDSLGEDQDFLQETRIVNGGENGLVERKRRFEIARQVIA